MSKVKILSPEVIAQIAAGEVIERPSSVVKELLENSLDAQATKVELHLKEAGKDWIHIKDNGHGIEQDDLQRIFDRHATSKISLTDDLHNLHSLGFRGEALYSVAAISDIRLKSKSQDDASDHGWDVHVRGGKQIQMQPAATTGHGTEIRVTELFYNTPARKKFLKSNTAEMNQILNIFLPYTLLYPHVEFLLTNNGKTIIDVKPKNTFALRMANALNVEHKFLIENEQEFSNHNISIRLVLGDINLQRHRKNLQFLFVNDRPVFNQNFKFHFGDVYRLILPPGVHPVYSAFIQLPPEDVDANMHPTKREVKIRQEKELISLIRHMVEHTLMTQGDIKKVNDMHSRQIRLERFTSNPNRSISNYSTPQDSQIQQGIPADQIIFGPGQNPSSSNMPHWQRNPEPFQSEATLFEKTDQTMQSSFQSARYIGQLMKKYLIWESADGMLLVDQHAAQERIMFEHFRNQMIKGKVETQQLLAPILLSLSPQEKNAWQECEQDLNNAGFETTLFDEETLALQAHPVLIKKPEQAARAILAGEQLARCSNDTLARRACRASIMTGDPMSAEQAEYQRKQLLACDDPFTCPHGRPTLIEITDAFLEKNFLRT